MKKNSNNAWPRFLLWIAPALLLTACNLLAPKPEQPAGTPTAEIQASPAGDARQAAIPDPVAVEASTTALPASTTPAPQDSPAAAPPPMEQSVAQAETRSTPLFVPPPPMDLWQRIRYGMQLSDYDHDRVLVELNWYARHQDYIDRVTERAEPFLHYILEEVEKRNMPSEIVLLPIVESAFEPFAYSHGQAAGIWQFIPGTGRLFGLKQNWWYDGRRDVVASTEAALKYLDHLSRRFNGNWLHALAAYNSGEGTVANAIRKNEKLGKPTDFWHLDLPNETRSYVPKLLAISALVAEPEKHGILLTSIENEARITTVEVGSQIDLALAAQLADLDLEEMYRLNPGFNRWATDPNGPHRLVIPLEQEKRFRTELARYPQDQRIQWKRHVIRSGESLITIAKQYHTSVSLLQSVNHLSGHQIRAGQPLIIPVARRDLSQYTLTEKQREQARLNQSRKGQKIIHTVQDGDTLWDLAKRYRLSVSRISQWNNMAPADVLQPGQKLVLWVSPRHAASAEQAVLPPGLRSTGLHAPTIRKIQYVVRRGDSLARISEKFNVTIQQLRNWNQLHQDKYLQPGQRLTLYVDVTRQT